RLENIRARHRVGIMNFLDCLGLGQRQKVVIALKLAVAGAETIAAKMFLMEAKPLNLGSHCAIEDQDALTRCLGESCQHFGAVRLRCRCTKKTIEGRGHKTPPVFNLLPGQGAVWDMPT